MRNKVDFYISNNNHHFEIMATIIEALLSKSFDKLRVVSLCEFRRMDTPTSKLDEMKVPYEILASLKFKGTSTSTGKKSIGGNQAFLRNLLRRIIWLFQLKPSLKRIYDQKDRLIIIPNDVAYPYNFMCKWFKSQNLQYVLIQEGIRFPLPNEEGQLKYGTNESKRIFSWGQRSVDYFRSIGINNAIAVGNPRIDAIYQNNYEKEIDEIRKENDLGYHNILYLSNPVDDQGFCSYEEKISFFELFIESINSLNEPKPHILIRLHPRENREDFEEVVTKLNANENVTFVQKPSIGATLKLVDYAIVLASTAGLESLLFGTSLGVIKIKQHGYIYDYVSSKVAVPIDSSNQEMMNKGINQLLSTKIKDDVVSEYVQQNFANLGNSAQVISTQILKELDILD